MATLRRIDPLGGSAQDRDFWRQSWRLVNAGTRRQYGPEASQVDADTLLEHRRRTGDPFAHVVATERDIVVGRLDVVIDQRDEPGVAHVQFEVMPPWREQGLGQQLAEQAYALVDELGAHTVAAVTTDRLDEPSAGQAATHIMEKRGFTRGDSALVSERPLDAALPEAPLPDGYALQVHVGVPDAATVEAVARLSAQLDAEEPHGDRHTVTSAWTPESLEAAYRRADSLGLQLVTVTVVEEATGAVVGMSQATWGPTHDVAYLGGTFVDADHRGRHLATAAKARAIAEIAQRAQGAKRLRTVNAVDNETMNSLNERLGFRPVFRQTDWRRTR